jgi:hypothetical protein
MNKIIMRSEHCKINSVIFNNYIMVRKLFSYQCSNMFLDDHLIELEKVDLVITDTYPRIPNFEWGNDRNETCCDSWTVNVNFTIIEFNLYFMVHRIVLKFEKIWLSCTLNIIRKPRKCLFSKRKRTITYEWWTITYER